MFDKQKSLQHAQQKLTRQQEILKQTLAEIEHIENVKPGAASLIKMMRTKRDRQATAIKATEELIELYTEPDPRQIEIQQPAKTTTKR